MHFPIKNLKFALYSVGLDIMLTNNPSGLALRPFALCWLRKLISYHKMMNSQRNLCCVGAIADILVKMKSFFLIKCVIPAYSRIRQ